MLAGRGEWACQLAIVSAVLAAGGAAGQAFTATAGAAGLAHLVLDLLQLHGQGGVVLRRSAQRAVVRQEGRVVLWSWPEGSCRRRAAHPASAPR